MAELDLSKYNCKKENGRYNFSKIETFDLPPLCDIQLKSYEYFAKEGIEELFKDFFPVTNEDPKFKDRKIDQDNLIELSYDSCFWEEPKHTIEECKESGLTYSWALKANLKLGKPGGEVTAAPIFMGEYPKMTPQGTFIINGTERVIVSQIVRSPGAYISKAFNEKTGEDDFEGDIIPARGTWLELLTDGKSKTLLNNDNDNPRKENRIVSCRIDKQKKVNVITLFRAIGLTDDTMIRDIFGHDVDILNNSIENWYADYSETFKSFDKKVLFSPEYMKKIAIAEIFNKLKPSEPGTFETQLQFLYQRFFDSRHYDLGPAGRFKLSTKLGIYNRLVGRKLAEDLITQDGEILFESEHTLSREDVLYLKSIKYFESGNCTYTFNNNPDLDAFNKVNFVSVYKDDTPSSKILHVVGTDLNNENVNVLTQPDIVALFSYFLNVIEGIGDVDDIDNLSNRRIKRVGELILNNFRLGLSRIEKQIKDKMTSQEAANLYVTNIMNMKPLNSAVKDFFNSSQLSQIMDQTNPLSELSNKRRISALGQGGISRERASMEIRDVHYTHYGRICPVETPEGQNIGLISNLACYAEVDRQGFIQTPYRKVDPVTHEVTSEICKLTADEEKSHKIAPATVEIDPVTKRIVGEKVVVRSKGENILVPVEEVDFIDVSPKQIVSIATACIPFLQNDELHRAMMGANMQRQALSLIRPHAPLVATGMERRVAKDSGSCIISDVDGVVDYVDALKIVIFDKDNNERVYKLRKFERSNQGTSFSQTAIVKAGDKVSVGQVIADGPAMENGELALGQNVLIAYMNWHGYNYEDAVVMSERLVKEDIYTSVHIEEYSVNRRKLKGSDEETFTCELPNCSEINRRNLDNEGFVVPGSEVKEGDILVGKITPRAEVQESNLDKLINAIFTDRQKQGKNTSLKVPHGGAGTVLAVKRFRSGSGEGATQLPTGVLESAKVFVIQKRKISEGDKMSGRHGNKGVISRILPVEDMPYLPDGRPIDILLSPLGVPSRMNIGQILEVHLGYACSKLGIKVATPVFDGVTNDELFSLMKDAGLPSDGKSVLYDGITGERYDNRINVGVMYMIKLVHMVDDKLHARSIGPYSLVTQQPLGGKAQNGGQRFGEMEVWALEAYGAAYTLQEMLTIKSDDMSGRNLTYVSLLHGQNVPKANMPESFRVLIKELQGLALDIRLITNEGEEVDVNNLSADTAHRQNEAKKSGRVNHSQGK